MSDYIHLTVASIVKNENKFLMVEEFSSRLEQNVFNQPAGHVENNEPIIEAIVRETLEETAWQVQPEAVIGIYQSFIDGNNEQTQYLRICFECSVITKTNYSLDPDILRAVWMTSDEILNLNNPRSPMVKRCLQDYLNGQRFSLDILTALR